MLKEELETGIAKEVLLHNLQQVKSDFPDTIYQLF